MPYDVRPTEAELSEARALVGVALDACERAAVLGAPLETPLHVALGWTDNPAVAEHRLGVTGTTFPDGQVEVAFDADTEGWTDAIGPVLAQQYGRVWVDERVDVAFRWQRLLREAVADRLAHETNPDGPRPWLTTDEEALSERWASIRDDLDQHDDLPSDRTTMGVAAALGEELTAEGVPKDVAEVDRAAVEHAGDAALQ
ncbi:hypothetical protein [Halomarina oriensis]|uniref:Uncharacterized protein n=1 Tax=Halomarina oriensis TaxID=671145 RepID=A0A6B0GH59_9EURY|nr:hypothetical protein [Halomarina oriensis]MWG33920.1 hypothetical protein [Halomarina oriensis]